MGKHFVVKKHCCTARLQCVVSVLLGESIVKYRGIRHEYQIKTLPLHMKMQDPSPTLPRGREGNARMEKM